MSRYLLPRTVGDEGLGFGMLAMSWDMAMAILLYDPDKPQWPFYTRTLAYFPTLGGNIPVLATQSGAMLPELLAWCTVSGTARWQRNGAGPGLCLSM